MSARPIGKDARYRSGPGAAARFLDPPYHSFADATSTIQTQRPLFPVHPVGFAVRRGFAARPLRFRSQIIDNRTLFVEGLMGTRGVAFQPAGPPPTNIVRPFVSRKRNRSEQASELRQYRMSVPLASVGQVFEIHGPVFARTRRARVSQAAHSGHPSCDRRAPRRARLPSHLSCRARWRSAM